MNNVAYKLKREIEAVLLLTLYFGSWIGSLVLLKYLILAQYEIAYDGLAVVLLGALVLAKVVLILEYVPLGAWTKTSPAWIDILLRTALYALGVLVVLIIEKAFEGRHDHGSFSASFMALFQHTDINHVWLNTLCVTAALLSYNILSVVRKNLDKGAMLRMFLSPLPEEIEQKQP
jgi:hypothetical protein